ncbi:MAG: extracellular solute-binding protein [Spirochaetaceae bacterium]|jgi:ABC-type glycerol-3-phosphate transport system substrate-binding protein|nr:extracellular solute-binding protein [Spirochaetaceae bacterium]
MKKSVFLAVLAIVIGAALFAGGGSQKKGDQVTLTVWDFKYSEEITGKAFREMDELFIAENPGVVINHVAQPESNFYQLLMSTFVAKNNVDVIIAHADNRTWNLAGSLEVLDPYITGEIGQYSAPALKAVSTSQDAARDIRMLPLTAQGLGFYYNKALFTKAGLNPNTPPSSWGDFLAACEALKRANIDPIILGNGGGATFGIDFTYRAILGTLYGNRLEGFRNGAANFTDPEFRQATQMIRELYDKGYINAENASISYFSDAIDAFKTGKGGFFPGLCSDIAHWKDFGEALGYENIGYFSAPVAQGAPFPNAQVNQGAGLGMAVVNYGKNKDIAVKYIKFYTSGRGGQILMNASGAIVPNSTIPVDSNNQILASIMDKMNKNGVPDYMTLIPGGMVNDFYNFQYLYFISKEISLDDYIKNVQELYRNSL